MRRRPGRTVRRVAGPSRRVSPERLIAAAGAARQRSYSPYSRFAVGAALLTRGGRIITGTNVENASFGLSICAERSAMFTAVGEGERDFVAIAVSAGPDGAASPCGACRQVLHEFAPDLWVYWREESGSIVRHRIAELLAYPFRFRAARSPRRLAPRPRRGRKA